MLDLRQPRLAAADQPASAGLAEPAPAPIRRDSLPDDPGNHAPTIGQNADTRADPTRQLWTTASHQTPKIRGVALAPLDHAAPTLSQLPTTAG